MLNINLVSKLFVKDITTLFWFKIHKITVAILIFVWILETSSYLIASKINCVTDYPKISDETLNMVCWAHGLKPNNSMSRDFLVFVPFLIFLQVVLSYSPFIIWGWVENGLMFQLVQNMDKTRVSPVKKRTEKRRMNLRNFLLRKDSQKTRYVLQYFTCEFLNLIILFVQTFLMVLYFDLSNGNVGHQLSSLFPETASCTFEIIGWGGKMESKHAVCVLPMNVLHFSFFHFFFYWTSVLSVSTLLVSVCRIFYTSRMVREVVLRYGTNLKKSDVQNVVSKLDYSSYMLLLHLKSNLAPQIFEDLILDIHSRNQETVNV